MGPWGMVGVQDAGVDPPKPTASNVTGIWHSLFLDYGEYLVEQSLGSLNQSSRWQRRPVKTAVIKASRDLCVLVKG